MVLAHVLVHLVHTQHFSFLYKLKRCKCKHY
jgi:hypothetical protein